MDHRAAPAQPSPDESAASCCVRHRLGASPASRRALVAGAVGVPLLAACGNSGSSSGSEGSEGSEGSGGSGSSGGSGESGGSASGIAKSDVPVGGGAIFADQEVVVTQPTEGEFKAFTAVCTHQQCLVTEVTDSGIDCSCHGSVFSIEDGSVLEGPAEEPLAEKSVTDDGDTLTVA
ncbi:Rieske (2Fe-2S) protein [Nocardioides marmoraquaticus]